MYMIVVLGLHSGPLTLSPISDSYALCEQEGEGGLAVLMGSEVEEEASWRI